MDNYIEQLANAVAHSADNVTVPASELTNLLNALADMRVLVSVQVENADFNLYKVSKYKDKRWFIIEWADYDAAYTIRLRYESLEKLKADFSEALQTKNKTFTVGEREFYTHEFYNSCTDAFELPEILSLEDWLEK